MGESGKNQALPMRDQGMTLSDALGKAWALIQTLQVQAVSMLYGLIQMIVLLKFII